MSRVDRQRCHHGKDEVCELPVEELTIVVVQRRVVAEHHAFLGEGRGYLGEEPLRDLLVLGIDHVTDRRQLLTGGQSVGCGGP